MTTNKYSLSSAGQWHMQRNTVSGPKAVRASMAISHLWSSRAARRLWSLGSLAARLDTCQGRSGHCGGFWPPKRYATSAIASLVCFTCRGTGLLLVSTQQARDQLSSTLHLVSHEALHPPCSRCRSLAETLTSPCFSRHERSKIVMAQRSAAMQPGLTQLCVVMKFTTCSHAGCAECGAARGTAVAGPARFGSGWQQGLPG